MRKVFATIKFTAFYFSVFYLEIYRLKYGGLDFYPLCCISMDLASRLKKSNCRWCLRVNCLGEYLHRRQTIQQEDGDNYIMSIFTVLFSSEHTLSEIKQLVSNGRVK
jgi:hypothetical protein